MVLMLMLVASGTGRSLSPAEGAAQRGVVPRLQRFSALRDAWRWRRRSVHCVRRRRT